MIGNKMPFKRVIALEHSSDHALSGLAQCSIHASCYKFQQLAYHPFDPIAIYGLFPIDSDYFTSLQSAYQKTSKSKWPIWIPMLVESLHTLEDTIWAHGKLEIVIAAQNIAEVPIRAAAKPNGCTDYFQLLGL